MNDRQLAADFLSGDVHDAALLVRGAGGDFSGVGVDRDCRQSLHRAHIAQMSAEIRLVDRQILVERQQHRRNHALGYEIAMAAHVWSPSAFLALLTRTSAVLPGPTG